MTAERIQLAVLLTMLIFPFDAVTDSHAQNRSAQKKLVEFGWDEPDTDFMRRHIARMEQTPFDGTVFHVNYVARDGKKGVLTWEGWGRRKIKEAEVRQAIQDLRSTAFTRFRYNFLRFNVTPADLDWFDDYSTVAANARLAAKVARLGRAKGILLDTEAYARPLFNYQRQARRSKHSWDAYARQARKRGREIMEAFQKGFPGLQVFLTFGYELPWLQCVAKGRVLSGCEYGLLAPFLDGMLEAAKGNSRIINGYESAYRFRKAAEFSSADFTARHVVPLIVDDPSRYREVFSFSFGLWMDADWREQGWYLDDPSRNFHPPRQFEANARKALELADEYVWIYSETPRWWSEPEGEPAALPSAYVEALNKAVQSSRP